MQVYFRRILNDEIRFIFFVIGLQFLCWRALIVGILNIEIGILTGEEKFRLKTRNCIELNRKFSSRKKLFYF